MNLLEKTLGCALAISGLLLTTGCGAVSAMAEGEVVTPEQRALEIIVKGDGSRPDDWSVNHHEVGAATHPVAVIAEHGTAHVRILDDTGQVVFEADSVGAEGSSGEASEDQPEMVLADDQPHDVVLVPGDYRVECAVGTALSTASLHVIPASGSPED